MAKKARVLELEGIYYPVKVKIVSSRTLARVLKGAMGAYVSSENTIYLDNSLNQKELLHTALHELVHSAIHHTSRLSEEEICDLYAGWMIRLLGITDISELK